MTKRHSHYLGWILIAAGIALGLVGSVHEFQRREFNRFAVPALANTAQIETRTQKGPTNQGYEGDFHTTELTWHLITYEFSTREGEAVRTTHLTREELSPSAVETIYYDSRDPRRVQRSLRPTSTASWMLLAALTGVFVFPGVAILRASRTTSRRAL